MFNVKAALNVIHFFVPLEKEKKADVGSQRIPLVSFFFLLTGKNQTMGLGCGIEKFLDAISKT